MGNAEVWGCVRGAASVQFKGIVGTEVHLKSLLTDATASLAVPNVDLNGSDGAIAKISETLTITTPCSMVASGVTSALIAASSCIGTLSAATTALSRGNRGELQRASAIAKVPVSTAIPTGGRDIAKTEAALRASLTVVLSVNAVSFPNVSMNGHGANATETTAGLCIPALTAGS